MPANDYTCFIVSPFGDKNGDETAKKNYEHFNTVMTALIIPTLRICGFKAGNIVRADREALPGRISESVEKHIREDDLCIIDLTGLNANVMYEYGMRVGIGKTFLAITSDAPNRLPFDVKDYQTMRYSLDTVGNLLESQQNLEALVRKCIEQGFQPKDGLGSYADLSHRLQAIERRLAEFSGNTQHTHTAPSNQSTQDIIRQAGSPIAAFNYALRQRDVTLAQDLLPVLRASLNKDRYIDEALAQVASMGSQSAAAELKNEWGYVVEHLSLKQQYEELSCYISFCNRSDSEITELPFVSEELEALEMRIMNSDLSQEEKNRLLAGTFNQTNRFYYGAYSTANRGSENGEEVHPEWLNKAIDSLGRAIELNNTEPAYYYNHAMCLRRAGRLYEAKNSIDRCLALSKKDDEHLSLAYAIYSEIGEKEKAAEVKETLRKLNPLKAALL